MTEYRVTRTELYETPGCSGEGDLTARQGHYITAANPRQAAERLSDILKKSKQLRNGECRFDVQVWKEPGCYIGSQEFVRVKLMS